MSILSDYKRMVEAPMVRNYEKRIAALSAELSRLEDENEQLRLAILGGEDVPGVAASLSLPEVLRCHELNRSEATARTEIAEVRNQELEKAINRAIDMCGMWSDHSRISEYLTSVRDMPLRRVLAASLTKGGADV